MIINNNWSISMNINKNEIDDNILTEIARHQVKQVIKNKEFSTLDKLSTPMLYKFASGETKTLTATRIEYILRATKHPLYRAIYKTKNEQ
jgi:hypothetical protein